MNPSLIPIFKGQNYYIWSIKMKTLLKSQGLWDLVENGCYTNTHLPEIRKNDATALFIIQSSMGDDIFPRIAKAVTSKQAWDILRQEYCVMNKKESVKELLSRVSGLVDNLKLLGDSISRESVVSNVLSCLLELEFDGTLVDEEVLQVKERKKEKEKSSWRNVRLGDDKKIKAMGSAPKRSKNAMMSEQLGIEAEDFFTSFDEVFGSFKAMGIQDHRLKGLYANAMASAPERSQNDDRQFDAKMSERLSVEAEDFLTSYYEVFDSFHAMGLQENLLKGIYANGFKKPLASQQRGIVPFCKGLDIIIQSRCGTGKTATFCCSILQQLDYNLVQCQALVLAPTKELALQIEKVMRALGYYLGVKVHACVGGTSVREDKRILQSGVHVVVGTPGRVFDMLRRPSLRVDNIKMFVLDKADELLSLSFKDQSYDIFQRLPSKLQIGVFTATMPPEALQFTRKFMNKPVRILM